MLMLPWTSVISWNSTAVLLFSNTMMNFVYRQRLGLFWTKSFRSQGFTLTGEEGFPCHRRWAFWL